MAFAHRFRLNIGKSSLHKRQKGLQRIKKACNFNQAHSIGIIFDASDPGNFEPIKNLAAILNERKIQVQVLGYVDEKKVPEAYLLRRSFNFFCRQDLNWIYKPKHIHTEEFMNKPYDILFDLDLKDHFPIKYISSLSKAHFKAGMYTEENEHLDFMINVGANKKLDYLITQLIEYLGELKTQMSEATV